jgi:hypothetical protein
MHWFGIVSVLGPAPLAVTLYERQLQMSQLRIEFRTAPLLLNLMVFEQSQPAEVHLSRPQDVSSYVAFMAKLVQSAEDARVLAEAEVLHQQGGMDNHSMEEAPRFFRLVGAASNATGALEGSYLRVTLELLRRRSDSCQLGRPGAQLFHRFRRHLGLGHLRLRCRDHYPDLRSPQVLM